MTTEKSFTKQDTNIPFAKLQQLVVSSVQKQLNRLCKHASVPTFLECVAAIKIKICLYLQNTIKLVSGNIDFSLYFCQLSKG